jgi:glycosyltransferase involved in cell wall biosynthesis
MPTVSVIIPAYNAEAFLARAIRSVEAQSFRNFEVVVVDDGSTDGTAEVARGFDSVRCIGQPHLGPAAARNRGLAEAGGDLVAFLDADDEWLPEKLERQLAFMRSLRSSFSYTDSFVVRNGSSVRYSALARPFQGQILGPLIEDWLDQAFITINTVVASCELIQSVGGFESGLPTASNEDYGLWLKLALEGTRFDYLDEPLARYYRGHVSDSSDAVAMVERHRIALQHLSSTYDFPAEARERIESALVRSDTTLAVELLKAHRFREAASQLRRSSVRDLVRKGNLFLIRRARRLRPAEGRQPRA